MGGDKQRAKAMKIFRREIGIWCSLNHVHVLPFYGTCKAPDGERLYMVSPWAEGGKALDYLQRNPHTNRGKLLYQTSSALDYLHSGKDAPPIIHGDLKADNVLVSITGDALLCDFGLSRFVEEKSQSSGSTSHGKGTVRFMAPESSPRSSKPSKESDVYAFGSLMLQIYTGKVPYSGLNEPQAMLEVAKGHTPSRPIELIVFQRGLNDNVWTLINACWNPDPRKRPTMKEILPQILLGAISV
ncbi:kinase-like protein [Ramaria rubella]|nr:kinase-like protein [Ramaria rubella]